MVATRVVLIDDHEMVREGLVELLQAEPDLDVVGQAASLAEGSALCHALQPDVAACDHQLPDGSGAELGMLVADLPTRVLVVSGLKDSRPLHAALANGCAGFVAKHAGTGRLIDSIRQVARDEAVFPAEAMAKLPDLDRELRFGLTDRELEVLELLAQAASSERIASALSISLHTARNHVRMVMAKLGASSRLEAVVSATRHGLVEIDRPVGRIGSA